MALDPVTALLDIGGKVIDRVWPNPAQAAEAKLELVKMQQSGELAKIATEADLSKAQIAVDQVEAGSQSIFVSGWRPFIGWVCGSGLAFQYIVAPVCTWGGLLAGRHITFPQLDTGTLISLLLSLLGFGAMRTVEKLNGVGAGLK